MGRHRLKYFIKEHVENVQGCKSADLANNKKILEECCDLEDESISDLIEELIEEDEIVEVEYVLTKDYVCCKSFLLPKGTKII